MEEPNEEYQRLRDENHQLQLRIRGVNELARLLQDKSEHLQTVQEKNKRLEVAVVRLEYRCANMEKITKSRTDSVSSYPPKTGQSSPFIPGPSRQILEGLMKENSELKKVLNRLTMNGASEEAGKITQLEKDIDSQNQEIQFLREQIKQLTTGLTDGETNTLNTNSGGLSLPDTGHLKKQLINLQHAMEVKEQFCTTLNQRIAELRGKLSIAEQQVVGLSEQSKSQQRVSFTGNPTEEKTISDEEAMESQNRVKGLLEDLIKQLTDGERDSLKNNSGNLSLSDTGHLRRQLLSLQHAMEKDQKIFNRTKPTKLLNPNDYLPSNVVIHEFGRSLGLSHDQDHKGKQEWIHTQSKGLYNIASESSLRLGLHIAILSVSVNETLGLSTERLNITVICFKNGLSCGAFTLRESVGMRRGSALPLDFVDRILSSKFWMMETDTWADLLIICRWANPTTTSVQRKDVTCTLCDEVWIDPTTTACGHIFCRKCLFTSISQSEDCPICSKGLKCILPYNQAAEKLLELYHKERQVKLEDLQSVCGKVMINCEPPPSLEVDESVFLPGGSKRKRYTSPPSPKRKCISLQQDTTVVYTATDLSEVLEKLFPARAEWYFLGLSMGLLKQTLDTIQSENRDNCKRCLTETIHSRLNMGRPLTLDDIIQALKKPTVGHVELATKLEQHKLL